MAQAKLSAGFINHPQNIAGKGMRKKVAALMLITGKLPRSVAISISKPKLR
jgi:hypothetical protein